MADLEKIFDTITERYEASAMPGFDAVVQFNLGDQDYILKIADGVCTYQAGQTTEPDAALTMDPEDFKAMLKGELNPMMAFMQGKVQVDGSMGTVMKLQTLLGG